VLKKKFQGWKCQHPRAKRTPSTFALPSIYTIEKIKNKIRNAPIRVELRTVFTAARLRCWRCHPKETQRTQDGALAPLCPHGWALVSIPVPLPAVCRGSAHERCLGNYRRVRNAKGKRMPVSCEAQKNEEPSAWLQTGNVTGEEFPASS